MLTDNLQRVKRDEFGANLDEKEILEASQIDISQVTLKISKVAEISETELQRLFEIFNKFEFVILECEPLPHPEENLLALKKFFGSVKRHKLAAPNGITSIENLRNSPLAKTYVATTNKMHLMHTDGSYEMEPPKIVAMQCEVPSKNGGFSQIVYAKSVYEYLRRNHPQELHNLFTHALTIARTEETATRPIFVEQEGRISMTFRSDSVVSMTIPPQMEKVYNIIKNYVNEPKNHFTYQLKAHQILLIDNTSVLHGRTSFPEHEFRKLNKLCFDGISEYCRHLQFGFIPK
ncbi:taurine catabolism dioxygenase TauD/TfdA [Scytonema sp. HK-05]|uniref:TauD/TfdA family dioxygenase n=1 Tax=Scytonema sp. HK-05 TaxID=1137095 RepID=UPI000936E369|nr:TauD/TfdA family dioxygenase [Scytonema sp. HK-05]OKH52087.1 taurine catabolism dioxygenase TauD [Scytonema sp. HK-05]BAY49802.1 taurine catabolism dioxygenase TauD/TfdA [Scytonema sp. HK-05]